MEINIDIRQGDCREELTKIPDNCVDLIFTSPPYADQRKSRMVVFIPISMSNGFCPYQTSY